MSEADYLENEIRQIILMMRDERFDGWVREGLRKKLERIRDLLDRELAK